MAQPSLSHTFEHAAQAAAFLQTRLKQAPRAAIILGTGLGQVMEDFTIDLAIDYGDIPHFPLSTVQSHQGRFIGGSWAGCPVAVLQGRFHLYEGYAAAAVTFPIRVLQALGVGTMILTNASGGLNPTFQAGDIMAIEDHINLTGDNPLLGPNEERWGERFPTMTQAYSPDLIQTARQVGSKAGFDVQTGVYAGLKGPSLETGAEMRFLRTIGADAVGFSTVMETIAAVHAGMQVLGLSTITNMCLPDALSETTVTTATSVTTETSVAEIIATAEAAAPRLATLISGILNGRSSP